MAIVKSYSTVIRNLAQLGIEINNVFNKQGQKHALRICRPLLIEYYRNMDYDWREWENYLTTENPVLKSYVKTQVPINHIVPASGTPLGYRYRTSGINKYPFDMFIITWLPGQYSPIHYHPACGCSYLILQGQITEKLFSINPENNKIITIGHRINHQGSAGYIDNNIGAHQIFNKFNKPAVSLHVYAPPGEQVRNIPIDTNNG